jgi:hypothetical protein
MISLISKTISKISYFISKFQVKQFLPIVFVGLMVLATSRNPSLSNPNLSTSKSVDRVDELVQKGNPERPKTTGEWNEQADETKGRPGEKLKRIGEQSADAIKEFGSMYEDVAERSGKELLNSTKSR